MEGEKKQSILDIFGAMRQIAPMLENKEKELNKKLDFIAFRVDYIYKKLKDEEKGG